ncbi:hypothetical protein FHR64_001588 [Xanthomonas arboricola]|nr:hypothetical protein [Xanthomonas arboricola]
MTLLPARQLPDACSRHPDSAHTTPGIPAHALHLRPADHGQLPVAGDINRNQCP